MKQFKESKLRLIYEDLVIEFESTDELFNDPLFKLIKEKSEHKNRIQELTEQIQLVPTQEIHPLINIENHLGFSINDGNAKEKLNCLSIKIPQILHQLLY